MNGKGVVAVPDVMTERDPGDSEELFVQLFAQHEPHLRALVRSMESD